MKKYKIFDFIELNEAKSYLSEAISENITLCDIYKFAVNGSLTLSIQFEPLSMSYAHYGIKTEITEDDIINFRIPSQCKNFDIENGYIGADRELYQRYQDFAEYHLQAGEGKIIKLEKDFKLIYGTWDLTMHGHSMLQIELALFNEKNNIPYSLNKLHFAVVKNSDDCYARLVPPTYGMDQLEDEDEDEDATDVSEIEQQPLNAFSDSLVIVGVKKNELDRFIRVINENEKTTGNLDAKQTTTRNRVIRALLEMHFKDSEKHSATGKILNKIQNLGFSGPSENTIRDLVSQAYKEN